MQAVLLFNSLPLILRNHEGSYGGFKKLLDNYLENIPDCPLVEGYVSHNMDKNQRMSNSLIDWSRNLRMDGWIPDSTSDSEDCYS